MNNLYEIFVSFVFVPDLKMCKYTAALEDTNIAIEMDPENVKAYYRRGLALQHKNQFQKVSLISTVLFSDFKVCL